MKSTSNQKRMGWLFRTRRLHEAEKKKFFTRSGEEE